MRFLWLLIRLFLLVAFLAGAAGLAAFLTFQFSTMTRSVEVPSVVGLSQAEAVRSLDGAGLRIAFEEEDRNVFDEKVPRDHVVRQEPAAGSRLKQNRRVRVVLSLGPRSLFVPRVVGEAASAAQRRLQESGLTVGDLVYVPSALVGESVTMDQEPVVLPPSGEARISLLVSSGRPLATYVMTDVIGRPGLAARARFEARGFRVRTESEPYDGVPEGTVIRQKPLAGYPVREGDNVWLWLSRPSENMRLP